MTHPHRGAWIVLAAFLAGLSVGFAAGMRHWAAVVRRHGRSVVIDDVRDWR